MPIHTDPSRSVPCARACDSLDPSVPALRPLRTDDLAPSSSGRTPAAFSVAAHVPRQMPRTHDLLSNLRAPHLLSTCCGIYSYFCKKLCHTLSPLQVLHWRCLWRLHATAVPQSFDSDPPAQPRSYRTSKQTSLSRFYAAAYITRYVWLYLRCLLSSSVRSAHICRSPRNHPLILQSLSVCRRLHKIVHLVLADYTVIEQTQDYVFFCAF